jgi:GH15 family glucan-1,4-alpha-glucosidase
MGESAKAEVLFERLLQCGNDLGLSSEEIDSETRELVGNFVQAFTHVALINAAVSLTKVGVNDGIRD